MTRIEGAQSSSARLLLHRTISDPGIRDMRPGGGRAPEEGSQEFDFPAQAESDTLSPLPKP